jgi:hypothetical protein
VDERYFGRRGRGEGDSRKDALAVDQHNALRPLPALGFPDFEPPLFAGKKLASIEDSS